MRTTIYILLALALGTSTAMAVTPIRGGYYEGANRDETPAEMTAERQYHLNHRYIDPAWTGSINANASNMEEGDYYTGAFRPN